jgi:predicted secreted hydrolase
MFEVVAQGQWTSPRTGTPSPQGWGVRVPAAGLQRRITPTAADQEPDTHSRTRVVYWEGSAGGRPVPGVGDVELVGYQAQLNV